MKILIIGGTRYIGRYLVKYLLEMDHDVTLFHRGKTNVHLYPEVDRVLGDRNTDIENLEDMRFDAVIDTCGYTPEQVRISTSYLKDKVDRYIFISSIAAFEPTSKKGLEEEDTLQKDNLTENNHTWWKNQYGIDKATCEQIVEEEFGKNSLIIRPGMVIGPYDPVKFLPYWILRIRKGGEVLAPGDPEQPMQYIDVRDLTKFMANMVDQEETGKYSVTGPVQSDTWKSFLNTIRAVTESNAEFTWIESQFLEERGLRTDEDLPYWLPGEEAQGYCNISPKKAINQGLEYQDLEKSINDVLEWLENYNQKNPNDMITVEKLAEMNRGMNPDKEKELLENYKL